MLTLYSYPELCGVPDNNGYGLKIFAFLRLAELQFVHEHIMDASSAPRGQLPYLTDDGEAVGDSEAIIDFLNRKYHPPIDNQLTSAQRQLRHLVVRMLDDLYWVMSYSRWKDEQFWPTFRDILKREHPQLTNESLQQAREFNDKRYYYQGIGRFDPAAAYARGLSDLKILADLTPMNSYVFGAEPTSLDAAIYGFVANIYFLPIQTPLKNFVDDHANLVAHCTRIHEAIRVG